jgi:hypothetical protein
MVTDQPFCSELSIQAGEPLFASATPTRLYLLLEYDRPWGTKALEESDLPDAVKARIKEFTRAIPESKLLLMRRGPVTSGDAAQVPQDPAGQAKSSPGISFYFCVADEGESLLYKFSLGDYQELLEIQLDKLVAGEEWYQAFRSSERLALVCTNGRRDRCCAKFGTIVFNALSQAAQEHPEMSVWQSTHMGGHRFAANLLWLPQGLLYGRVNPTGALAILQAYFQGRVYLPNLRGRAVYPEAAQAADYLLRQRSCETSLEAYRLVDYRESQDGQWQVEFVSAAGEHNIVKLALETSDTPVYESCALDKTTKIKIYRLID